MKRSLPKHSYIAIASFFAIRIGVYYGIGYLGTSTAAEEVLNEIVLVSYVFALFFGIDLIEIKVAKEYMKSTFLIYALHLLVLSVYKKVFRIILPSTEGIALLAFIVVPILTVVTICPIAYYTKKICKPMYRVLAGGRN